MKQENKELKKVVDMIFNPLETKLKNMKKRYEW